MSKLFNRLINVSRLTNEQAYDIHLINAPLKINRFQRRSCFTFFRSTVLSLRHPNKKAFRVDL